MDIDKAVKTISALELLTTKLRGIAIVSSAAFSIAAGTAGFGWYKKSDVEELAKQRELGAVAYAHLWDECKSSNGGSHE